LAGDPAAAGEDEGLCGLALDLGAELLLMAIGVGEIVLIEGKERCGEHGGEDEDGRDDAVERDAGGLHGGELRVAVEQAEGDHTASREPERR